MGEAAIRPDHGLRRFCRRPVYVQTAEAPGDYTGPSRRADK